MIIRRVRDILIELHNIFKGFDKLDDVPLGWAVERLWSQTPNTGSAIRDRNVFTQKEYIFGIPHPWALSTKLFQDADMIDC